MHKRLTLFLFILSFFSSLVSALLLSYFFRDALEQSMWRNVRNQAAMLEKVIPSLDENKKISEFIPKEMRVTVIDASGKVLEDSWANQAELESHFNREEFKEAKVVGNSEKKRYSETLQKTFFYYALKMKDGKILRLSMPMAAVDDILFPFYLLWGVFVVVLFVFSWRFSVWVTKKLLAPVEALSERLDSLDSLEGIMVYKELEPLVKKIQKQKEDISKQLRQVEKERLRLSSVVHNITEGLLLLGRRRQILLENEAANRIFSSLNNTTNKHSILESCPQIFNGLDEVYGGNFRAFECELSKRSFRVTLNPVFRQKEVIGVVCLFVDISERKNIEKMRRDFTANVSHELKTPLTSISGYAEIIEAGFVQTAEIPEISRRIQKESARLLELINDIIKLTELDSAEECVEMEDLSLMPVIQECCDSLQEHARKKEVNIAYSGKDFSAQGNGKMLYEMLYNLIDNGIRYNVPLGKVEVLLQDRKIFIKDSGIGIPEKHIERIFERFYRVDKSRSKATGGTGLGLAIVKHIAECHGIRISLTSKVGEGTEIILTFP